MNLFSLSLASIKARPLQSLLCLVSAGAGIGLLSLILLMSDGIENGLTRNMRGIDIVVGAKGSPLQLILSTVFHADVPNGNIEAADAAKVAANPQVAKAIPIAIGDSYKGFRVVGTEPDYISLFDAQFSGGQRFADDFEAVAGSDVALNLGDEFEAAHGLSFDSDDIHHFHKYKIVGKLKPTGTVIDRLIVTSLHSVQELHVHADPDDPDAKDEAALGHQMTALLIKVRGPVAVINLPRAINRTSNLLATSPAYELTRFSHTIGLSRDVLTYIGGGFLVLASLTLLSSLSSSLAARRYDLGVLRSMGASPFQIWATVMNEGLLIGTGGGVTGVIVGHVAAWIVAENIPTLHGLIVPSTFLAPSMPNDLYLVALGALIGGASGLIPARLAAKTDISDLLTRGKI